MKVTEPADDGRANAAVIEMLAAHFGVPRRSVAILRGLTSRQKLIQISESPPSVRISDHVPRKVCR